MSKTSDDFNKTHVALITETWAQSFARDATTAATFMFLWSVGHYAESAALEWVGVMLGAVFLFIRMMAVAKRINDQRMTPDQARAWLDEKFPPHKDERGN